MEWLLTANDASARIIRTIVQGVLASIPGIINYFIPYMPEWTAVVFVPLLMCIISPIMAELGNAIEKTDSIAMTD